MQAKIVEYFQGLLPYIFKYHIILISIAVVGIFGLVFLRINEATQAVRSEERYSERLVEVQPIQLNEEAISSINSLKAARSSINPELPTSRDNPF